jgi:hypothetical protein
VSVWHWLGIHLDNVVLAAVLPFLLTMVAYEFCNKLISQFLHKNNLVIAVAVVPLYMFLDTFYWSVNHDVFGKRITIHVRLGSITIKLTLLITVKNLVRVISYLSR